jgi:hypothetical protein
VQARLREELRSLPLPTSSDLSSNAPLDGETLDQLDQLPLLDAVVCGTLRLHPPVIGTARAAMCDNAIPVSTPYVDRNGVTCDFVNVVKDDAIFVPIVLVNRSKEIWGEDAHDWKYVTFRIYGAQRLIHAQSRSLVGWSARQRDCHSCCLGQCFYVPQRAPLLHWLPLCYP